MCIINYISNYIKAFGLIYIFIYNILYLRSTMSTFLETFLASLAGITAFYLLEAVYYDIKARIRGKQYTLYLEELEEELER